MSGANSSAETIVQPQDIVATKEAFLFLAAEISDKTNRTGGARGWNPLASRCLIDHLIDTGQTEHPIRDYYGDAMPERSPLKFIWVPDQNIAPLEWNVSQVGGIVIRSLVPYAANVRSIMAETQEQPIAVQREKITRYAGTYVGEKVVSFWEYVCQQLLPANPSNPDVD